MSCKNLNLKFNLFKEEINKKSIINIFFCGIGGIGMSGLAIMAKNLGYQVFGSNNVDNDNIHKLMNHNINNVFIGHDAEHINSDIDLFVYTTAVKEDNVEMQKANDLKIPKMCRGDFLAYLMDNYFNIVIAGSHGKTTTSSMTGYIADCFKLEPTIIVGGVMNQYRTNSFVSKGKYLVAESDESDGSFINMKADIGIITNIDEEHMDYYHTYENLMEYFDFFAQNALNKTGLVICYDNVHTLKIIDKYKDFGNMITYSYDNQNARICAINVKENQEGFIFDVFDNKTNSIILQSVTLKMFGKHNVLNFLATICSMMMLNLDLSEIKNFSSSFSGIEKRFTVLKKINNFIFVDDYAHNTQKIKALVDSSRHYLSQNFDNANNDKEKKLIFIFEPHRYTRMQNSIEELKYILTIPDVVLILDLYSASEKEIEGINSKTIVNKIKEVGQKNIQHIHSNKIDIIHSISDIVKNEKQEGLVVFCGAGLSSKLAKEVVNEF